MDKASRLRLLLPAQRIPKTCPPGPVLTPTYLPQAHISGPADPLWQKHKVRRVLLPQGLRAGDEGQTLLVGPEVEGHGASLRGRGRAGGGGEGQRPPPPPPKTGLPVGQGCTQVIPARPCPPGKRSTWWGLSWAGVSKQRCFRSDWLRAGGKESWLGDSGRGSGPASLPSLGLGTCLQKTPPPSPVWASTRQAHVCPAQLWCPSWSHHRVGTGWAGLSWAARPPWTPGGWHSAPEVQGLGLPEAGCSHCREPGWGAGRKGGPRLLSLRPFWPP